MKISQSIIVLFFMAILVNAQKIALIDTANIDVFSDKYFSDKCVKQFENNNNNLLTHTATKWIEYNDNEASARIKLLTDIYNHKEFNYTSIIKNMLIYKALITGYSFGDTVYYLPYKNIAGYPELDNNFNNATKKMALSMNKREEINTEENILTEFYSNHFDSSFIKIQELDRKHSLLYKEYRNFANEIVKDSFRIKFGLLMGLWYPTGNASVLGNHFGGGFVLGFKLYNGWGVDLSMMQRIGSVPDSIEINFNDTITRFTNHYLGGYCGINLNKNIYRSVKNEFDFTLGAAIDGFSTIVEYPEIKSYFEKNIRSYNINFGLIYKRIIKQKYFTEIQLKYNIMNYVTHSSTDLKGNAITLNIGIGILSGSGRRAEILQSIDYKY